MFRIMITPVLMTVIYVIGVILISIGAVIALVSSPIAAVVFWFVGQLYLRVVVEFLMVVFRINDNVAEINRRGRGA